ncbi:MAG: fumarylacetoacetate hydrolase family protein, partial [Ginsengibacter sp.]
MTIFCLEQNYLAHKRDRDLGNNSTPEVFLKPGTALLPKVNDMNFQQFKTARLYAQCEIVLHISADGKDISEEEAGTFFDSITTGINFTKINIQDELDGAIVKWEEAKAWPHSSAIGEWFNVKDYNNSHDINFCMYYNREMGQMANTDLMIADFNKIISMISSQYALHIGDIIFTGSPL